ncbi:MAG: polysaccharide deacetylase family protein, partial [Actinomycetota bacterium]|nr:polysaccharide deacetylase family protein [Actinomycetota bacterium]
RADVPALCWHQIRPIRGSDGARARPYIVGPRFLAAQLDALQRVGYHAVGADAVVAHVARGARLPSKPVLLTFDDASAGQVSRALPLLRAHRFTATFFVMTVVLDKPGWMTRADVRGLDRAGMTIGAHTWDHRAVPQYSGDDWTKQIDEPTRELERIVGHRIGVFAYPFGLWSAAAFAHLRAARLAAAFQLADKLDGEHPLYTLRRIIVPQESGAALLRQVRGDF